MFRFFVKNKGAISVFLTLILIPTFIFGGVLIDGSRILGAKNLVSGAGDLAMNAALSNYHEGLNQTYGLLAMAESAEEVSSIMEDFFRTTLQAVDISEEDFSKALVYLEFTHDDFYVSDVPGTEIFQTEVFRQEVLEYMKYRAPAVWLDRAIGEKAAQLENIEKEKNAADGELKFESGLDDVQEIFDDINECTEVLENVYKYINEETGFNNMLNVAKTDYEKQITVLSIAYCSMEEAQNGNVKSLGSYDPSGMDTRGLMEEMVSLSCDVSHIDADIASNIIKMRIVENNMIGRSAYEILKGVSRNSDEYIELSRLIEDFEAAQAVCSEGISKTRELLEEAVRSHYTTTGQKTYNQQQLQNVIRNASANASYFQGMYDQRMLAELGKEKAEKIINELLPKLRHALEKSRADYENWVQSVEELREAGSSNTAQYDENLKEYSGFFDEAEGYLGEFETLIQTNITFYTEVTEKLDTVTFTGKTLDKDITDYSKIEAETRQYGACVSANEILSNAKNFFNSYQDIASGKMNLSINKREIFVSGNEFVEKMKTDYCNTEGSNEAEAQAAAEEWNEEHDSKLEKLKDLLLSEKAPDVNVKEWDLPSNWLGFREYHNDGAEGYDGSKDIAMGGGLDSKENRKEVSDGGSDNLNRDNENLNGMSNLAEHMGQKSAGSITATAVEKAAEPLFLTEYVMGMFTCYTYDLDTEGNILGPEECQSLSGADMDGNILKYGEIEYILWGISDLRSNVGATKAVIFAANLVFNLAFAFTNSYIRKDALEIAALFPVGALGKTAIKCALQVMVATIETTKNMLDLMDGKAVPLIKLQDKWDTWIKTKPGGGAAQTPASSPKPGAPTGSPKPDIPIEMPEFTYQDYLWIFVCVGMYSPKQDAMLARTADCIELNMTNEKEEEENSLRDMFTMVDLEAAVSIDTFFLQRLSGAGYHVQEVDDETFKIKYYGVQGY